jgi:hypothetical protein
MYDLAERLRRIEENPSPDLWTEITDRHGGLSQPEPVRGLRHRVAAGLVAGAVAVAAIGFLIIAYRPGASPPANRFPTAADATTIDLGEEGVWSGGPLVAGDGAMWIVGSGAERPFELVRIDPVSLQITDRISLGFADTGLLPTGLAVGDGSAWIAVAEAKDGHWDLAPGELLRIDETTGKIPDRFAIPPDPSDVAVAYGSVWLAEGSGKVARIDPTTGRVLDEFEVGRLPADIVPAFDSLWIIDRYGEGSLVRLDPSTGHVLARFAKVNAVSAGETRMWVEGESEFGGSMRSIDPATNEVSSIAAGQTLRPVYPVVQGEGQTWLTAFEEDPGASPSGPVLPGDLRPSGTFVVLPIDPATGASLAKPIRLCSGSPGQPSIAYGALWFPCAHEVFHLPLLLDPGAALLDGRPRTGPASGGSM